MRITLKLFATFQRYLPAGSQGHACDLDLAAGTSVAQVLAGLNIPAHGIVILVNGRTVRPGQVLQEGDVVAAFPAIAGG